MRTPIIIAIAISFLFFSFNSNKSKDLIEWNLAAKLDWNDYLSRPIDTIQLATASDCGIYCIPLIVGDSATVTITAYFDRQNSWVRRKLVTPELLAHEQGHFNLTEIYARKLRRKIKHLNSHRKDFTTDCRNAYEKVWTDLQAAQKEYDRATDYSKITFVQKAWNDYITKYLVYYQDYSASSVTFKVRN